MFEIEFYEDIKGNHPIENFLDSLDIKMRAKIPRREIILAKKRKKDYIERMG